MSEHLTRHYTPEEVTAIVRRALNGQSPSDSISYKELLETAKDLGVSPERLEAAVREQEEDGEMDEAREKWRRRRRQQFINGHLRAYLIVNGFLFLLDLVTTGGVWFFYPMLGWGIGLAFDASAAFHPDERHVERGACKLLACAKKAVRPSA